jgi:hypothetical protein
LFSVVSAWSTSCILTFKVCASYKWKKNANKTYFMLQKFFKNKTLSKKLKLRLKNTIIDKVLTYASETWTLTKRDRK